MSLSICPDFFFGADRLADYQSLNRFGKQRDAARAARTRSAACDPGAGSVVDGRAAAVDDPPPPSRAYRQSKSCRAAH